MSRYGMRQEDYAMMWRVQHAMERRGFHDAARALPSNWQEKSMIEKRAVERAWVGHA